MSEKTFWWKSALKSCHQKHCAAWLSPLLQTYRGAGQRWHRARQREWFAAPRRLALKVANLAESQPDREVEKRGPAIAQALTLKANRAKRQKVGHVAAASRLIRLSV